MEGLENPLDGVKKDPVVQEMLIDLGVIVRKDDGSLEISTQLLPEDVDSLDAEPRPVKDLDTAEAKENCQMTRSHATGSKDADVQPISSEEECADGDEESLADTLANLVLGLKEKNIPVNGAPSLAKLMRMPSHEGSLPATAPAPVEDETTSPVEPPAPEGVFSPPLPPAEEKVDQASDSNATQPYEPHVDYEPVVAAPSLEMEVPASQPRPEFPEVPLSEGYVTRRDQLSAKQEKKAKGKGKGKGRKAKKHRR